MPCPDRSSNTGFWELHLQPPPGLPQAPPPGTGDRRAREREATGRSLKVRHGRVHVEGASSKSGHRSLTAPSIPRREALPPVALLPHPPPEGSFFSQSGKAQAALFRCHAHSGSETVGLSSPS